MNQLQRPWITFYDRLSPPPDIIPIKKVLDSIISLIFHYSENSKTEPHILWVYGKPGSGRRSHIMLAANTLDFPLLFVDICQILYRDDFEILISEIVAMCSETKAVICFESCDGLFAKEQMGTLHLLLKLIECVSALSFFVAQNPAGDWERGRYILGAIEVASPSKQLSAKLWDMYANGYCFDVKPDFNDLAEKFSLTPLQIKNCIENSHCASILNGCISASELYKQCRQAQTKRLFALGNSVSSDFCYDDIILPDYQKKLLKSIEQRIAYRHTVYDKWGLGRITPYGKGITVLFEGPSGTGKTMAAQVLSNHLSLPMYKIDLSALMNKYIGETEKNLKAVFDEAAFINCILFFDEADAVFGKRTDITDSKDRHSNLGVSYLLQRIEEYQGITILATNLIQNFDDSFKRRFEFIIPFRLPNDAERMLIWKSILSVGIPLSDDIDINYLSKRYQLSGSGIKSIIISSAFKAAAEGVPVAMKHINEALDDDSAKRGMSL